MREYSCFCRFERKLQKSKGSWSWRLGHIRSVWSDAGSKKGVESSGMGSNEMVRSAPGRIRFFFFLAALVAVVDGGGKACSPWFFVLYLCVRASVCFPPTRRRLSPEKAPPDPTRGAWTSLSLVLFSRSTGHDASEERAFLGVPSARAPSDTEFDLTPNSALQPSAIPAQFTLIALVSQTHFFYC